MTSYAFTDARGAVRTLEASSIIEARHMAFAIAYGQTYSVDSAEVAEGTVRAI